MSFQGDGDMLELLTLIMTTIAKDYKVTLILSMTALLSIGHLYLSNMGVIDIPLELLTICNTALLILFIIALTYRLRSIKKGMKELYFTLPYHRETIYFVEVASAIIFSLLINIIASIPYLGNMNIFTYSSSTILPSIFLGVTVVNISDDRWRNTIQWLIAIFLLPFLAEIMMYILSKEFYTGFYWIFNLLPHEIYLSLVQVKSSLSFLNIGFNIVTYFIYLGVSLYIGIYIRERRDIL